MLCAPSFLSLFGVEFVYTLHRQIELKQIMMLLLLLLFSPMHTNYCHRNPKIAVHFVSVNNVIFIIATTTTTAASTTAIGDVFIIVTTQLLTL